MTLDLKRKRNKEPDGRRVMLLYTEIKTPQKGLLQIKYIQGHKNDLLHKSNQRKTKCLIRHLKR